MNSGFVITVDRLLCLLAPFFLIALILAVGLSFAVLKVDIWFPALVIGLVLIYTPPFLERLRTLKERV